MLGPATDSVSSAWCLRTNSRLTVLFRMNVESLANFVCETVEALLQAQAIEFSRGRADGPGLAATYLVLVGHDSLHDSSPPASCPRLSLRLLLRYEDFEPPALRQVGLEELFEQRIRQDAHAEGRQRKERPVLIVVRRGGTLRQSRLRRLPVFEEVLQQVRDTAEITVSWFVPEDEL